MEEDVFENCRIEIRDGFIVRVCTSKEGEEKITHVCVPGTRSKEGGISIFGSGANGGYGHPDIECLPIEEIEEKIKKKVKNAAKDFDDLSRDIEGSFKFFRKLKK